MITEKQNKEICLREQLDTILKDIVGIDLYEDRIIEKVEEMIDFYSLEHKKNEKVEYHLLGTYDHEDRTNLEVLYIHDDLKEVKKVEEKLELLISKYDEIVAKDEYNENENSFDELQDLINEVQEFGVNLGTNEFENHFNMWVSVHKIVEVWSIER